MKYVTCGWILENFQLCLLLLTRSLANNGCVCEGDKPGINFPFAQLLFPQVSATQLHASLKDSDLQKAKQYRNKEYHSFRKR